MFFAIAQGNRAAWSWCSNNLTVPFFLVFSAKDVRRGVSMTELLKDFWLFLSERKKWWLFPIVLVLVLLGGLVVLGQGSALAPFIYSVF